MPIDIIQNIEKGVLPNTATTQLFLMDVEKFLDALPMQPIFDLVVTSPPYNLLGRQLTTPKSFVFKGFRRFLYKKLRKSSFTV